MTIYVRLSAGLARAIGRARLVVALAEGATVTTLVDHLRAEHPELAPRLAIALPVVGGRHVSPEEPLRPDQEVAFLLPVAGGAPQ